MKKTLYYLSWFVVLSAIFLAGVGTAKSVWGGVFTLVVLGAVVGIIELGDD